MYKIIVVACRNLVESKLPGTFSPEMISAYERDLCGYFANGRLTPGYRMLIDVADATIQSQASMDAFIRHAARMPKASRIAVVTGNSIIRMQVRRVMRQPYLRLFDHREDAIAWLLAAETAELAA